MGGGVEERLAKDKNLQLISGVLMYSIIIIVNTVFIVSIVIIPLSSVLLLITVDATACPCVNCGFKISI